LREKENFSIINKGMTIEGTISFKGKLSVMGTVKGIINGDNLVIGKEGSAYADIRVNNITIGGLFEGKLNASSELIILNGGKCEGEVICKSLVIEPGGLLNGKVTRLGGN
jgi:cytoskeletal protein CcmA (bactofilin family)